LSGTVKLAWKQGGGSNVLAATELG